MRVLSPLEPHTPRPLPCNTGKGRGLFGAGAFWQTPHGHAEAHAPCAAENADGEHVAGGEDGCGRGGKCHELPQHLFADADIRHTCPDELRAHRDAVFFQRVLVALHVLGNAASTPGGGQVMRAILVCPISSRYVVALCPASTLSNPISLRRLLEGVVQMTTQGVPPLWIPSTRFSISSVWPKSTRPDKRRERNCWSRRASLPVSYWVLPGMTVMPIPAAACCTARMVSAKARDFTVRRNKPYNGCVAPGKVCRRGMVYVFVLLENSPHLVAGYGLDEVRGA